MIENYVNELTVKFVQKFERKKKEKKNLLHTFIRTFEACTAELNVQ